MLHSVVITGACICVITVFALVRQLSQLLLDFHWLDDVSMDATTATVLLFGLLFFWGASDSVNWGIALRHLAFAAAGFAVAVFFLNRGFDVAWAPLLGVFFGAATEEFLFRRALPRWVSASGRWKVEKHRIFMSHVFAQSTFAAAHIAISPETGMGQNWVEFLRLTSAGLLFATLAGVCGLAAAIATHAALNADILYVASPEMLLGGLSASAVALLSTVILCCAITIWLNDPFRSKLLTLFGIQK